MNVIKQFILRFVFNRNGHHISKPKSESSKSALFEKASMRTSVGTTFFLVLICVRVLWCYEFPVMFFESFKHVTKFALTTNWFVFAAYRNTTPKIRFNSHWINKSQILHHKLLQEFTTQSRLFPLAWNEAMLA